MAAPNPKLLARWQGVIEGRHRSYATREPGGFGMLLSGPNSVETVNVKIALREELDLEIRAHRTVIESVDWTAQLSDLYYENPDGSRVSARSAEPLNVRFTEAELNVVSEPDREYLDQLQSYVEEARHNLQEAQAVKQKAAETLRARKKPTRDIPGSARFETALNELRRALAHQGEHDERTDQAYKEATDALSAITEPLNAEIMRLSSEGDPLVERATAVLNDPNASPEAKAAASAAMVELSKKLSDASAAAMPVYDWFNARYELVNADAALMQAQRVLRDAERRFAEAKAQRVAGASADAGIRIQGGRRIAYVSFSLEPTHKLKFPVDIIPLRLENIRGMDIRADSSVAHELTILESRIPLLDLGFKGENEARGGQAIVTFEDSKQSGSPGLIGGGEWQVKVTFSRQPEPIRYEASAATVSEIPPYSIPAFDMIGLQFTEQPLGSWSPDWVDEYPKHTEANPLNAAFSDAKQFRFMHVLSAYVETQDHLTISSAGLLTIGPNGEQTTTGHSIFGIGARDFRVRGSQMKLTVDGVEVAVFEQAYGAQTLGPEFSTTIPDHFFPPVWTVIRLAIAADGRRTYEVIDHSYPRRYREMTRAC